MSTRPKPYDMQWPLSENQLYQLDLMLAELYDDLGTTSTTVQNLPTATTAVASAGIPGPAGADGDDGMPGPPGAAGATGATGASGAAGSGVALPGFPGEDGDDGMCFPSSSSGGGGVGDVTKAGTNAFTGTNSFANNAVDLLVGQLKFPATQNASADPNTLDDYEEGTWTPVIGGATSQTGQTYGLQDGRYVKFGKWVTVVGLVYFSGVAGAKGTITGVLKIKGLPFTAGTSYSTGPVLWDQLAAAKVYCTLEAIPSTTEMSILGIGAANTTVLGANLTTADLGDSSLFLFSAQYEAAG